MLTVEPLSRLPTGAQFLAESRAYLLKQQAKLYRTDSPRLLNAGSNKLEQFGFEAEAGGQRVLLEYYINRQAQGGATLAARLLPNDLPSLRMDVERIALSVQIGSAGEK